MIQLKGIKKSYGEKEVLSDISFAVEEGTVFGILGTNGVGKTTTLKIIAGLLEPTAGEVWFNGKRQSLQDGSLLPHIGFVPDHAHLYEYLTGKEYLRFVRSLFQVPIAPSEERIHDLLVQMKLDTAADHLIKTYSHGMRQKLSIAAALIHQPRLLLLDEPLTGIDLISSRTIRRMLAAYKEAGNMIILSTHLLELAHALCDRIGIIHEGKLVRVFATKEYPLAVLEKEIEAIYL